MINSEYVAKKSDGAMLKISIRLGVPELDPESGGYRCKVEVPELAFNEYSYGVDA